MPANISKFPQKKNNYFFFYEKNNVSDVGCTCVNRRSALPVALEIDGLIKAATPSRDGGDAIVDCLSVLFVRQRPARAGIIFNRDGADNPVVARGGTARCPFRQGLFVNGDTGALDRVAVLTSTGNKEALKAAFDSDCFAGTFMATPYTRSILAARGRDGASTDDDRSAETVIATSYARSKGAARSRNGAVTLYGEPRVRRAGLDAAAAGGSDRTCALQDDGGIAFTPDAGTICNRNGRIFQ